MVQKRATKYGSKRKTPARRAKKIESSDLIFTGNAIFIGLDAAAQRKAQRCLQKNGKITFSVAEHSITRLHEVLDNGKLID